MSKMILENPSKYIDHTLLKPNCKKEDIVRLCKEAQLYGMKAVCVPPFYVSLAKNLLEGSDVKVATVIGFPLGYNCTDVKVFETSKAIADGADEIDVVMNISKTKDGDWKYVQNEIFEIMGSAKGSIVKVIIETCLLTNEEKIKACKIIMATGVHFIKTSTGFSERGATVEDVQLIKSIVGDKIGIKASGGIRDRKTFEEMIQAGATRIGTSSALNILREYGIL